jgi:hypothetical protein
VKKVQGEEGLVVKKQRVDSQEEWTFEQMEHFEWLLLLLLLLLMNVDSSKY